MQKMWVNMPYPGTHGVLSSSFSQSSHFLNLLILTLCPMLFFRLEFTPAVLLARLVMIISFCFQIQTLSPLHKLSNMQGSTLVEDGEN